MPLEFAKGKDAIKLSSGVEVAVVSSTVRVAAEKGDLAALNEQQAQLD